LSSARVPSLTLNSGVARTRLGIDKMRSAYGCPLRTDQTADLAEFISHAADASAAGGD
jgi:hypothetical protein